MIVGISKSNSLANRYKTSGTEYTRLKYDIEGKGRGPLVAIDIPGTEWQSFTESSELARPVTARVRDLERVTKVITSTPSGYKWSGKMAAALALQNRLDSETAAKYSRGIQSSFWKKLGNLVTKAVDMTASTLEQVAIAGTGVRMLPFEHRTYAQVGNDRGVRTTEVRSGNFFVPEAAKDGSNLLASTTFLDKKISDFRENPKLEFSNLGDDSKSTIVKAHTNTQEALSRKKLSDEGEKNRVEQKLLSDPPVVRMLNKQGYRVTPGGKEILNAKNTYGPGDASFPKVEENMVQGDSRDSDLPYVRNGKILYGLDYAKDMRGIVEGPNTDIRETPDSGSKELELSGLIPFYISSVTPDRRINCFFEANLDSYADNYTGNWENTQYVGRADSFVTYSGFERKISFAFKVAAKCQANILPIYNSLNYLAGTVAPTYNSEKIFMRGTMVVLRIGDMLIDQVGIFTSINFKWDTNVPWEIVNDGNGRMIVPHMLTVDANFTPIHEFVPTADSVYFGDSKQILNQNSRK